MATDSSYTDEVDYLIVVEVDTPNRKPMIVVKGIKNAIIAVKNHKVLGYNNVKMERL